MNFDDVKDWYNDIPDYVVSATIFVISIFLIYIVKIIVIRRLKAMYRQTDEKERLEIVVIGVDQLLKLPLVIVLAFYFSVINIDLTSEQSNLISILVFSIVSWYLLKFGFHIVDSVVRYQVDRVEESKHIVEFFRMVSKAFVFIVVFLWFLSSLGIPITSFVAGLGIFGLAIAFALQNVIADLFASLTIFLDRPFEIGDSIRVGGDSGTVEKVGIRSSQLRTPAGHLLVISNRELSNQRISNFKQMERRRIAFNIGVSSDTPVVKLKKIPKIIETLFKKHKEADFNRVFFRTIGDFSFNFEIVYYVNTRNYTTYLDIQQDVNYGILEQFEKEGIVMPYPTQSVVVKQET
jgi:small-conductance mechanosensitive channel